MASERLIALLEMEREATESHMELRNLLEEMHEKTRDLELVNQKIWDRSADNLARIKKMVIDQEAKEDRELVEIKDDQDQRIQFRRVI